VRADVLWLKRVFEDLVENAIKFSPADKVVTLAAERRGAEAFIRVADQGCGLEAWQIPHIFDPFYTAEAARHNRAANGLGLALCRRVVECHGGRIWAESSGPGRGCCICFTVPAVESAPSASTAASALSRLTA
jgi:signal transduction histidine kinase